MFFQISSRTNLRTLFGIALASVILILQFQACTNIAESRSEILGCDPLGYSQQARIFRSSDKISNKIITDLKGNVYENLRDWASTTSLSNEDWYQMIAPHCHHYRESSGLIIDQYPFGTGWLLSLLPEKYARRWLIIISISIIAGISIGKILLEKSFSQKIFRTINAIILIQIIQDFWNRSDSLAPSVLIAFIAAEIAIKYSNHTFLANGNKSIYSLLLGLVLGFSICIRPGNLFFSFAAILSILLIITSRITSKKEFIRVASWGSLGYLPGVIANAYFNLANTGSALQTTYTTIDTSFANNTTTILGNIGKIPDENGTSLILISAFLLIISLLKAILLSKNLMGDKFSLRSNAIILTTAWTSLILFVIICLSKNVFISYYLAAQVAFMSSLVCCCNVSQSTSQLQQALHIQKDNIRPFAMRTIALVLISINIFVMAQTLLETKEISINKNPLPLMDTNNTILWADSTGSYLYWHYGIPTAKLLFGSDKAQTEVIKYLQVKGVTQLFMDENNLVSQVSSIDPANSLELIGQFREINIYKLKQFIVN